MIFSISSVALSTSLSHSLSSPRGFGATTAPPCSFMSSLDALKKLCPLVSGDIGGLSWVWSSNVGVNGCCSPGPVKIVGCVCAFVLVADGVVIACVFC